MTSMDNFLSSLSAGQKSHGGHNEALSTRLCAGNLSMIYQGGSLRHICDSKSEIIRMIYSAVRDRDWLTIAPDISNEQIKSGQDWFTISYDCLYNQGDINFFAKYTIMGASDSSVVFRMEGEALETFEKSRVGFCVLHPIEECAGQICEIIHSNGLPEHLEFPRHISPSQPFMDIRSMKWKAGTAECLIDFEGDIFETEDQRNWTDASYKTYCTPLELPCPAKLEKGTKVSQQVRLKVEGAKKAETGDRDQISITIDEEVKTAIPLTGIGRSTRDVPLSMDEISVLKEINFDHYRADMYLFRKDWQEEANIAVGEAMAMNLKLEAALFFDENSNEEAVSFVEWALGNKAEIAVVHIFHNNELATPPHLQAMIPSLLKARLPGVKIGFGTNANYAELGRSWPDKGDNDVVCYSVHPQEHASDNMTIVENLQGQAYTVQSAVAKAMGKVVWVTPVNIQRRFNANIEAFENKRSDSGFPPQADSRIMSLLGAGWTAASIRYIAESGAGGMTCFETAGERGIIQGDYDSRWPGDFPAAKGMIFPVYHVFRYLLQDKSFSLLKSSSAFPLRADGIFLSNGKLVRAILMNLTADPEHVVIDKIEGNVKLRIMNEGAFVHLAHDPRWLDTGWESAEILGGALDIDPYSLVFLEYPLNF